MFKDDLYSEYLENKFISYYESSKFSESYQRLAKISLRFEYDDILDCIEKDNTARLEFINKDDFERLFDYNVLDRTCFITNMLNTARP